MKKPSAAKVRRAADGLYRAVCDLGPMCPSDCPYCEGRLEVLAAYFGFKLVEKGKR